MSPRRSPKTALAEYRRKRDFSKTAEPSGAEAANAPSPTALRFVIQKHAASHLHFDFRLELDGVMKSWAVPKGPSLDPKVKRLAMEVEDHPISYNTFEGTIPKGEYGGGTVMLWDRGFYTANDRGTGDDSSALRQGYAKGKLDFTLHGERLHGSWALVRTRRDSGGKAQWLLIKHRDEFAVEESDIVADELTSVDTGRTMEEIAVGKSRVWHSNRAHTAKRGAAAKQVTAPDATTAKRARGETRGAAKRAASTRTKRIPTGIEPMYATIGSAIPSGSDWTFEPKWDGIRVLAFATPKAVHLITRNGKDKAKQFPEVASALKALAAKARRPLVLDGEIVALSNGEPARFQQLQGRMHVIGEETIAGHTETTPASLIVFDMLADGDEILLDEPWTVRRRRLEARLRGFSSPQLRLGETMAGAGEKMLEQARREGWEGIIAKRTDARYRPGHRSDDWRKLKIEHRQEFVVGGYTEPRNTREHIGALLLGYFDGKGKDGDGKRFVYVGHTGGGFTREGLREMHRRLKPLERQSSPFETPPKTNERAHWVTPKTVVEVKFSEWTGDGKLRQPIYLGTRDDKDADEVGREPASVQKGAARRRPNGRRVVARSAMAREAVAKRKTTTGRSAKQSAAAAKGRADGDAVVAQLREIEDRGGAGTVMLGRGSRLEVSNLGKVYFPDEGYTKGDLMRYYAGMAPFILPVIADRPLVLKRYPNGIAGKFFFQQNAPDDAPESVRVEMVEREQGERVPRIVGGDLATLLYTVQLGCIAVDPWHGRVRSLDYADYTILDLDPGPRAPFSRIVEVARWVREELDALGLHGALKTSGSRGLHIYVPMPPRTPGDAALLVAQIIATRVADRHPKEATIERAVKARPAGAVYVDYMQNVRGKSVAAAYSVRAKQGATVSTPLEWKLDAEIDPHEFTMVTVPERVARVGDLWAPAMRVKNSLDSVLPTNGKKSRR